MPRICQPPDTYYSDTAILSRIAVFCVWTAFAVFRCHPPSNIEYLYVCVFVNVRARLFLFCGDRNHTVGPGCRSPPSDFDLPPKNKSESEDNT